MIKTMGPKRMSDTGTPSLRHHVIAALRDFLVIAAFFSVLSAIAVGLTRPYWQPIQDSWERFSETLIQVQEQLAELRALVDTRLEPRLLEFHGNGIIVGNQVVPAGGEITVFYSLRRNAACDTEIERNFYNIERGTTVPTGSFRATKAPVTRQFVAFKIDIRIPEDLAPGMYLYRPTARPLNCGIYSEMVLPPAGPFQVTAPN